MQSTLLSSLHFNFNFYQDLPKSCFNPDFPYTPYAGTQKSCLNKKNEYDLVTSYLSVTYSATNKLHFKR